MQLTECEDPLLQQKAELIFRDNIPQWKVDLDDGDGDDDDDGDDGDCYDDDSDDNEGKGIVTSCRLRWQLSAVRDGGWNTLRGESNTNTNTDTNTNTKQIPNTGEASLDFYAVCMHSAHRDDFLSREEK